MKRRTLIAIAALPAVLGLAGVWLPYDLGFARILLAAYAVVFATVAGGFLLARFLTVFLWRVGRKLAFSYFLIGALPIPMVALLILVAAYLANGYFLGHLYRDAVHSVASELRSAARTRLVQMRRGRVYLGGPEELAFAYYRGGIRFGGDPRAPMVWEPWWASTTAEIAAPSPIPISFVATADGEPRLMAAMSQDDYGVLAFYDGDLARVLSERSGVWIDLERSDEEHREEVTSVNVFRRHFRIQPPRLDWNRPELVDFFHPGDPNPSLLDRPSLLWVEISRPFLDLETGQPAAEYVAAALTASPRTSYFYLNTAAAEVDTFAYVVFFLLAFALFDLWVVAVLVALLTIFGASRAVDLLSRATQEVQLGDFSTRIEVRRADQIGELHRSFNQMTANLEELVAEATQKEILEKELEIARELQRSLLPGEVVAGEGLEVATHFAPSAAIGGDYYDLLPLDEDRLAVVVADVSGHGLSAGLRMAMVKSALQLLCEEEDRPEEILRRLHRLQRASGDTTTGRNGFVTATLTLIDRRSGELLITNAGHPPTYLLRGGGVREIVLPSSPLGALQGDFGQERVQLLAGDAVVWLSDGLIEATNGNQEPFGYEGVARALTGPAPSAAAVRDRLLAALDEHTGGSAPEDDRSLVVMVYRPSEPAASSPSSSPSAE